MKRVKLFMVRLFAADLLSDIAPYLSWADAACCSVSQETALALYHRYERMRGKQFAQATVEGHLLRGTGLCLLCDVETRSGTHLLCREGPVSGLRELVY